MIRAPGVPFIPCSTPWTTKRALTGVIDGLAKISGKWCVIIGFDNKVMAGAWIAGQADNILRVTDMAKRLMTAPGLAGQLLRRQADRAGEGLRQPPRQRHHLFPPCRTGASWAFPILAGIYGTNPAGGGYQGISPTILLAHKNCNIAVGGGGIVSGMSPKGVFDEEGAEQIIEATRHFKEVPPGSVEIHYDDTGFFRAVYEDGNRGPGCPQGIYGRDAGLQSPISSGWPSRRNRSSR